MTETHDPTPPPPDYGNGDTWADDGPWYVPPDLRPHYAAANPSKPVLEGYLRNGVSVVEQQTYERQRVIDAGDDTRPPTVVYETQTEDCLVDRGGADYFPTWLHGERLTIAVRNKKITDDQTAREAAYLVCALCGVKAAKVRVHRAPETGWPAYRIPVASCPNCFPVIDHAVAVEYATRDAARTLPDGRRAGDVAADLARSLLGPDDEDVAS